MSPPGRTGRVLHPCLRTFSCIGIAGQLLCRQDISSLALSAAGCGWDPFSFAAIPLDHLPPHVLYTRREHWPRRTFLEYVNSILYWHYKSRFLHDGHNPLNARGKQLCRRIVAADGESATALINLFNQFNPGIYKLLLRLQTIVISLRRMRNHYKLNFAIAHMSNNSI